MSQSPNYETLIDVLDQSLEKYADCELFGTKDPGGDGTWSWLTYREFGTRVSKFRGGISALGIGRGDTVGIISSNRVEWAIAAYATYGLGGRLCPMYESQLEKDWQYIVRDSGATILITSTLEIYETVRSWPGEVGQLEHVFCMALPASDKASFAELEKSAPLAASPIDSSMVCGFIYTSGTTGKPKGVLLSHENICSNLNGIADLLPVDQKDVSVSFLPWAHSFGQTCELHSLLSRGAAMAIAESVEKLVDNFIEVRPTVLFSVPRIFNRIYDGLLKKISAGGGVGKALFEAGMRNQDRRRHLAAKGQSSWLAEVKHRFYDAVVFSKVRARFGGRLRYAVSGGAALSPEVAHFIDKLGIFVCEGYGLTETSPIVSTNHPKARKIGSVGQPIPGVKVVIDTSVVDNTRDKPIGEIVVYGPNVMKGYHGPERRDRRSDQQRGWLPHRRSRFCRLGRVSFHYRQNQGAVQAREREVRRTRAARRSDSAKSVHQSSVRSRRQSPLQHSATRSRPLRTRDLGRATGDFRTCWRHDGRRIGHQTVRSRARAGVLEFQGL